MDAHEQALRETLGELAASPRGRSLLQLALRGIESSERAVTAGCWAEGGVAGCLFQHAYWQGVAEGVFGDEGRPGDWIGAYVGTGDYTVVVRSIAAFDRLAGARFSDVTPRRLLPDRRELRHEEWSAAVRELLLAALAAGPGHPEPARPRAAAPAR
jgi:hypothetical protein